MNLEMMQLRRVGLLSLALSPYRARRPVVRHPRSWRSPQRAACPLEIAHPAW